MAAGLYAQGTESFSAHSKLCFLQLVELAVSFLDCGVFCGEFCRGGCIPDSCIDGLVDSVIASNPGCTVVFRPHPQYVRRFPAKMQSIMERYAKRQDVVMEADFSKPSTMDRSDVLITDWSGIAYKYAFKTKRPVVFIDMPMKIINPDQQPTQDAIFQSWPCRRSRREIHS